MSVGKDKMTSIPTEADVQRAVGHQFPGGTYTIQHWENFLLTECTGAELLPGGMVHPVVLFHMPILASGTTISEMFALGRAESDSSIGIESYDWEMFGPLYEERTYRISGRIISAQRQMQGRRGPHDRIQFEFVVTEPDGEMAARTTITWHYHRSGLA